MTPAEARAWLETHPGARTAAVGLVCLLLGLVIGRWTAPRGEERSHEKETTHVQQQEGVKTFSTNAQQTTVAKASSGGERIHRVIVRERCPAGPGTVTRVEEIITSGHQEAENMAKTEAQMTARVEYRDRLVDRVVEKTVEKAAVRPAWRFGLLAGVRAPDLLSGAPGGFPWLLGGSVEHRLAGPFSVGGWGLSSGSAGVSVEVDW